MEQSPFRTAGPTLPWPPRSWPDMCHAHGFSGLLSVQLLPAPDLCRTHCTLRGQGLSASLPCSKAWPLCLLLSSTWLPGGQLASLCTTERDIAAFQLNAPPLLPGTPFKIVRLEGWRTATSIKSQSVF